MTITERKKIIGAILTFIFLVMGVALISPLLGGGPSSFGPGFILWGIAPMLVALLMRIATHDWSDAGVKPGIGNNARWYIFSIFAFPVMTVSIILIGQIILASSFSGFRVASYLTTFFSAFPIFFIFAFFEEFGWRGYLVPKLVSSGLDDFLTYAIVAGVWATWHLPYFRDLSWVYSPEDLISFIPRFYLAMFANTILYHEIRIVTGSIWPAVLMHCIMNSFGHPLFAEYVKIAPGMNFIVSSTGFFMIIFTGLVGIALNRYRKRKEAASPKLCAAD